MTQKTNITVVDSIMGSGKTSWAINKMNGDWSTNYIYITPFLKEVTRIKENCPNRRFTEPKNYGDGKKGNFHELLMKQKNISSTHALFSTSTQETIDLIKSNNYSLILDEVMDVVELINTKKDDIINMLKAELITIEDKVVTWNKNKIDNCSQYDGYKNLILSGNVVFINGTLLIWNFPINVFKAFNEVYILTFLFDAQIQKYYYDLYELDYEYKSIGNDFIMINYSPTSEATKESIRNNLICSFSIVLLYFYSYLL